MLNWISDNKVFSGIGGVILTLLVGFIGNSIKKNKDKSKPNQSITAGDNSNNIQGGKDVKVTIGDKNVGK